MAIKRTITRKYGVRPVQMDVSSGALALSQATQNVANTVSNVTKFIDDNQFQQAVLDAEIQGRQLGTQTETDSEGNIVPKALTVESLNNFTADIYNKANIRKAQQYFKREAINSYGLALQNHAIDIADASLQTNGGKLNEKGELLVKKASESYIKGLKGKLAPEVFSLVSPAISKVWGQATRKASAIQLKELKATHLFEAEKNINYLLAVETNLITNGGSDEDADFLANEKARVFQIIDDNAPSKLDALKMKTAYNQQLQQNVAINAIDAAYEAGVSISDMLTMAIDTRKSFANNENIDGEKIESAMRSKIAIYEQKETDLRGEQKRASNALRHQLENQMYRGLNVADSDIEKMQLEDQNSFFKARNAFFKNRDTKMDKILNENVALSIAAIENDLTPLAKPTQVDFADESNLLLKNRGKVQAVNALTKNYLSHKDISRTNKEKIMKLNKALAKEQLKLANDSYVAMMERMFDGGENGVLLNPRDLIKPEYINELKNKRIIGIGDEFAYDEKGWVKRVMQYEKNFRKMQKKAWDMSKIGINQDRGVGLNANQKATLEEDIIQKTFIVDGQEVEYDIFSPNEDIRNESFRYYAQITQSYGYVPQDIAQIFNNLKTTNDDTFAIAKMLYATMKKSIITKHGKNSREEGESFFEQVMINSDVDSQLMDSSMFYADVGSFRTAHSAQSINRSISEFFRIDGKNEDEVFNQGFQAVKDYLGANFFESFYTVKVGGDPYEDSALKAYVNQSGASNFEEAIIKDPSVRNEMLKMIKLQIQKGNVTQDANGLNTAVKKAFYKIAPYLSIHEDKNGQAYLIRGNSIVREAQTTVPTGGPLVTKEVIIRDMKKNYFASFGGGTQDPVVLKAIDDGDIMFIGNNDGVGDQTYKVVAVTGDGRYETLANNYRWNYQGSEFQSDYYKAINKIQNEPIRRILNSVNFMSKNVLNQTMTSIAESRNYSEGFEKLVNAYNNMAGAVNRSGVEYKSLLPYLKLDSSRDLLDGYFDEFLALGLSTR